MFQNFAHLLKKKKKNPRLWLTFLLIAEKVVFPYTFLLHRQKTTPLIQPTDLYLYQ